MNQATARLAGCATLGAAVTCAWWAISGVVGTAIATKPAELFFRSSQNASTLLWAWRREFPSALFVCAALLPLPILASGAGRRMQRTGGFAGACIAGSVAVISLAGVAMFMPLVVTALLVSGSILWGEVLGEVIGKGVGGRAAEQGDEADEAQGGTRTAS